MFIEDRTHNSSALNIHKYWAYCIPYTLKRSPDTQLPFVRNHYLHCYIEVIAENTKKEKYMYRELLSIRMLFHWDLTSKFPIQVQTVQCALWVPAELSDVYSIINLDAWECQNDFFYSSSSQHTPTYYPSLNSMSFEKTTH